MKDIKEFYEKDAKRYDTKRFESESGQYEDQVHKNLLSEFLAGVPDGGAVVEIGCGTGRLTMEIERQGFDTTGVDVSRNMLRTTRERLPAGAVKPVQGDARSLPFRDDAFDACVMINVASHLPTPEPVFHEIGRILNDDGKLFVNFPNLTGIYFPIAFYINATNTSVQDDVYSRWYSRRERNELLAKTGFTPEEMYGRMITPRREIPVFNRLVQKWDGVARDSILKHASAHHFVTATR